MLRIVNDAYKIRGSGTETSDIFQSKGWNHKDNSKSLRCTKCREINLRYLLEKLL